MEANTVTQRIFNIKTHRYLRSELRANMPEPEKILWQKIRGRQLGVKFRRQHGIGRYIVDFYCAEKHMIIELDGDSHYGEYAQSYDVKRDEYMASIDLKVMRFTNNQIVNELEAVMECIYHVIKKD